MFFSALFTAKIIVVFAILEAVLMVVLPGKKHYGPVTPAGTCVCGVCVLLCCPSSDLSCDLWVVLNYLCSYPDFFLSILGSRPQYKLNGILTYIVTHLVLGIAAFYFKLFDASIIFDNFGSILSTLSLFSFLACFALYYKGKYFPTDK